MTPAPLLVVRERVCDAPKLTSETDLILDTPLPSLRKDTGRETPGTTDTSGDIEHETNEHSEEVSARKRLLSLLLRCFSAFSKAISLFFSSLYSFFSFVVSLPSPSLPYRFPIPEFVFIAFLFFSC